MPRNPLGNAESWFLDCACHANRESRCPPTAPKKHLGDFRCIHLPSHPWKTRENTLLVTGHTKTDADAHAGSVRLSSISGKIPSMEAPPAVDDGNSGDQGMATLLRPRAGIQCVSGTRRRLSHIGFHLAKLLVHRFGALARFISYS
jgi:hypothetical protein